MSEILRREGVYLVTVVVALIMIVEFFFDIPALASAADMLRTWVIIISTMALALGAVNIMRVHWKYIKRREPGHWTYSICLITVFAVLTILGLINLKNPMVNPVYKWMFENVYTSLGQTLYAITGFYIFSAAYRAFRARNSDAAILLIAGCLVLLTNAPIGEVIWSQIPVIGTWVLEVGETPAMRTFLMTAAFGLLAYGFRTLIGKERGFYGEVAGGE